jgi:ABC-2 type transport system permease protein
MKFHRIKALVFRYLYIYPRSMPRILDLFLWPVLDLLVWGFLSVYLEKINLNSINIVSVLLGAVVFWTLMNRSQEAVTVSFLEDVWEKNLMNVFVTPVRVSEFLIATLGMGIIRIMLTIVILGSVAFGLYHFNIFQFGIYTLPFIANLLVFGWVLGILVLGIILRFGTSAQVLAFTFMFIVQPFSAVFYPVSALPGSIRWIAYIFPSTYVFEGMRAVISTGTVSLQDLLFASGINVVYLAAACWFFYTMFRYVKNKGALMKFD